MTLSASQWQFIAMSVGPGLAVAGLILIYWLAPDERLEIAAIKAGIALTLGPITGMVMHRVCVPHDHATPVIESHSERWRTAVAADAAAWRRVVLIAAATLTIGVVL